jgi:hypothetical protein
MSALLNWATRAAVEQDWKKVGLACGSVVFALLVGRQLLRSSIVDKVEPETLTMKVELLDLEKEMMMRITAVTTVTTYKAKRIPESYLKKKLADLIRKNPWLCARIVNDSANGLHIAYPGNTERDDVILDLIEEHMTVVADFELPEHLSYDELMQLIKHLQVKRGNECINKPHETLFRVTLLKILGRDELALVVSISHVLADGFTYYKILSMLDNRTPVTAMEVTRHPHCDAEVAKLVGQPVVNWLHSPFLTGGMVSCALFRGEMRTLIIRVDDAWIQKQKAAYAQIQETNKGSHGGTASPAFVSTNDILTAWHNRISKCAFRLMAINARNRVPALTDEMAGNYESSIVYNMPEDCDTPQAIRASLSTFRSASGAMPGPLKTLLWDAALTTNWCTFFKQVSIRDGISDGANARGCFVSRCDTTSATLPTLSSRGDAFAVFVLISLQVDISDVGDEAACEYLRHLPATEVANLRAWGESVVFFKLDANTTGIKLATRRITAQMVEASGVGTVCVTV